ncbi:hypothetical protein F5B21DRAFT_408654 [Xylaria acuta]|nr:hypothetical protein F5B21DRAFT_408654 [Xylaria acuta]
MVYRYSYGRTTDRMAGWWPGALRRTRAAGQRQSSRWFSSSHFGSEIQTLAWALPHVSWPNYHSPAAALRSDIAQDTPCPARDEARTPCFACEIFSSSLRQYLPHDYNTCQLVSLILPSVVIRFGLRQPSPTQRHPRPPRSRHYLSSVRCPPAEYQVLKYQVLSMQRGTPKRAQILSSVHRVAYCEGQLKQFLARFRFPSWLSGFYRASGTVLVIVFCIGICLAGMLTQPR